MVDACKTVLWRNFCVRSVPGRGRTLGREKIGMKFAVPLPVLTKVDYLIKAGWNLTSRQTPTSLQGVCLCFDY